ncbi:hypothetical protein [Gulosibacter chungangensis]|uniref:Uncharacterized protein n=1 Tax=Gulosibacter chungangensis TaxID=979746 RepID=A0A7J5BF68_9MICO|nr:hypothetical protein [Gulosibacter chungangensis]KAB1644917.1 hypothetical protein F8O05_01215 [Gulosibacter chungangensis]
MTRADKNAAKIEPGDGSALKPVRGVQALWRTQFGIRLIEPDAQGKEVPRSYAVDVNFFDLESRCALYRDGSQHLRAKLPVKFPVHQGQIEVADSTYGMTRIHLLRDGQEQQLVPMPGTAEFWRAKFGRNHPVASRIIGWLAIAILLVSLVLLLPWVIELISQMDFIAERFGTFTNPLEVPGWLGSTLAVASVLAGLERALTIRSHWLIDADTYWLGD